MEQEDRKREFLEEPIFHGCPISWAQKFFNQEFRKYREKHKDFDTFLIKLGECLRKYNDGGFNNLIQMAEGEIESNWLSPHGSMIRTIIKIYNYCFSPKQAYDYISKCYRLYKKMKDSSYKVSNEYHIEVKTSRWDGNTRKFLSFQVGPEPDYDDLDDYYWFDISFSTIVYDDGFNDFSCAADVGIKLRSCREIFEHALSLFVNHQDKEFLRKIFWSSINYLKDKKIINEVGVKPYSFGEAKLFEFKDDVGHHKIKPTKPF